MIVVNVPARRYVPEGKYKQTPNGIVSEIDANLLIAAVAAA
jgi:hypothetical protein